MKVTIKTLFLVTSLSILFACKKSAQLEAPQAPVAVSTQPPVTTPPAKKLPFDSAAMKKTEELKAQLDQKREKCKQEQSERFKKQQESYANKTMTQEEFNKAMGPKDPKTDPYLICVEAATKAYATDLEAMRQIYDF